MNAGRSANKGSRATSPGRSLMPVIGSLLAALIGLQVLFFVTHAYQALTFAYQLDYGEGPILQIAVRAAEGRSIYPPVDEPPYVIASYLPVYYWLGGLGVKLFGVGFLFGRLLSCLAAVAIAVCAALVVWDRTRQRFAAFLGGGLILAMPHFIVWSTFMRVDMLALAFAVAGFWLFLRGRRAGGVSAFALGVLTRRTTLAAMGAAFVREARERGLRPAVRVFGAQIAAILGLVGIALILTRGGLYRQLYLHTATSVGEAWTWQQLWSLLWVPENPCPLRMWPAYFAITAGAAVWSAFHRPSRSLLIYFVFSCVIFLTAGRIGSAHNYLLEPTAVGAMMFGVMWAELAPRPRGRLFLMLLAGGLAAQMLWTTLHVRDTLSILQPRVDPRASAHVVERIERADGPVLCEETGLTLFAGRQPPLMPFEFTMMAGAGALDPEPVYEAVREGRYALIVLRFNPLDPTEVRLHEPGNHWKAGRWPDGIISGVVESYRLDEEAGPYFIFVPRRQATPIPAT